LIDPQSNLDIMAFAGPLQMRSGYSTSQKLTLDRQSQQGFQFPNV
jgi:hypothetical protein